MFPTARLGRRPGATATGGGPVISGGNFHGQPVALAMDFAKIAIAELGSISERRTALLLDGAPVRAARLSWSRTPGLNSGLMLLQYTAAALVSENKVLAHPASVDSIPTSANQEDHVSMGSIAARHARDVLRNVRARSWPLSCCAPRRASTSARRTASAPGAGVAAAHARIRARIPHLSADRDQGPDISNALDLVTTGALLDLVPA